MLVRPAKRAVEFLRYSIVVWPMGSQFMVSIEFSTISRAMVAVEMALTALPEVLSSIPSNHMVAHNHL